MDPDQVKSLIGDYARLVDACSPTQDTQELARLHDFTIAIGISRCGDLATLLNERDWSAATREALRLVKKNVKRK